MGEFLGLYPNWVTCMDACRPRTMNENSKTVPKNVKVDGFYGFNRVHEAISLSV